jgi:hypothetical protein
LGKSARPVVSFRDNEILGTGGFGLPNPNTGECAFAHSNALIRLTRRSGGPRVGIAPRNYGAGERRAASG